MNNVYYVVISEHLCYTKTRSGFVFLKGKQEWMEVKGWNWQH